ncbi:MAG TPA: glutamine amidotransferase, partial [Chthoniobacteraceae bacterium]|nr:glutamine amidotransferase [Chthoniobacteraceae bacterium]
VLAIVADNSLSMKLRGRGEAETRGETMLRVLTGERNLWRTRLAGTFEVRNYFADSRLQATQDFREVNFAGRTTALGAALRTLAERHRGQPLAGVIVLTDGVAADLEGMDLAGLPPIFPVVLGSDQPPRDLAIASTAVTQTSFEDAPVTVQADVTAIGAPGEEIVAKLFAIDAAKQGENAKPVAEQTLTVPRDSERIVFRFQLRPDKTGVLFYRLRIAAKGEWDAKPEASSEATLANNETIVTVDRGAGAQRVLYVSGRPNWEYKFLHRAIEGDSQTQLVALIRIAKREPKFEFRGRAGESSNPLFRGFGNQSKEEVEQYDKPVLVRLGTEDAFELRDGFPKTAEELFKYRAVIVDDLEAEFFTADQMSLLQRFVSERGGGFLMLGGMESFVEGGFARTAIGDMLPVYVGQESGIKNPESAAPRELRLALTREGWLQPWARLRNNEADERARLTALPRFDILNRTREAKPTAMVVATVSDGQREYPALVTQRFGRGRTAALLIGDLWASGLGDEARQKDLGKAWRQLVRWLVADVPEPIELRAEPQTGGELVKLLVRARDAKFLPMENAAVTLKVQPVAGGAPITLQAEASAEEPGLYEASYIPRESGGYRVDASVAGESGAALGAAATGWTTDLAAAEFRSLVPNRALMEAVAKKTGGEVLTPERLESFARELPARRAPVTENFTQPLWHTPAMLLFALACFVGEWGIRRWKGLA